MDISTLQTIWFILIFVLLAGYAVLDGFDLGVGMLHLSGKTDSERRLGLQAIGPVWDGNEVWLLTGGGALFAAFPFVYATVFSAFYLPLVLVLVALIGRATAIEFRSKEESPAWRKFWDIIFFAGSGLAALLFGVAFGNILRGLPISPDTTGHLRFTGGFFGLLNPFSIAVGLLGVLLLLMQGAMFLAMKSTSDQQERMRRLIPIFWLLATLLYLALTVIAMVTMPYLFISAGSPLFFLLVLITVIGLAAVPMAAYARKFGRGILASSAMIAGMMALAALGLFPRLVPSSTDLLHSLNIHDHSSSQQTLTVMFIIAAVGVPIVLIYTIWIYRVFKGKQEVDPAGY
jgi:cytochrome d ubiquinol oxidase subunit II